MLTDCTVSAPDGRTHPGVLALPGSDGPLPGVVVIHDLMGFCEDTRRHCLRFSEVGYAALAPDLYGGASPSCVVKTLLSFLRGAGAGYEVIAAARRRLAEHHHRDMLFQLGRYTPMRAAYDPGIEAESWSKVLAFFERHLGSP